jgi:Raf kinase inhibitor-like YbhB/YbcL family protein
MIDLSLERLLGRAFRRFRAGDRHLTWNDPRLADAPATIRLTSPAFADGAAIPTRHAGAGVGDDRSPPLAWSEVPAGTAELVLIVEDPDAPLPPPVIHLVARGIAPERRGVAEGALSPQQDPGIAFGRGSFGRIGYAGPRPVRGHGPHRYIFQIFAVGRRLAFAGEPGLRTLLSAMAGSVLARGKLTGIYERS